MPDKSLRALHPAIRDDIADLTTRRPLPGPGLPLLDPFLFLNHHGPQTYPPGNSGLPFGPHPHRGFETVTFILDGELAHRDSAGHESIVRAGGVQWMTAGRGIVHAELSPDAFKRSGGPLEILQLWVNLPARLKWAEPGYAGLQQDALPVLTLPEGAGTVQLVSGLWDGVPGPVPSLTGVMLSLVWLRPGGGFRLGGLAGRAVLLYTVRGRVTVAGHDVPPWHLAELADDGDALDVRSDGPATLLFGHADPIREPVVAHGPFVMNSVEEIRQAILDYRAGRFG